MVRDCVVVNGRDSELDNVTILVPDAGTVWGEPGSAGVTAAFLRYAARHAHDWRLLVVVDEELPATGEAVPPWFFLVAATGRHEAIAAVLGFLDLSAEEGARAICLNEAVTSIRLL